MFIRRKSLGFLTAMVATIVVSTAVVAIAALPPGGTFVDDDGNAHEPMIEAIAAEGITEGCALDPPRYCPDAEILRSEMATLVVRALNEEGNLPTYQGYFADVPEGQWYTPWVERLHELGLTEGCGTSPLRYCPNETVLRTEMAAFLVRDLEGEANLPDYQGYFADVPSGLWYTPWVERLYELGITNGCLTGPLRFCPDNTVRRDEMASFLGRALDLDPIVPPPTTTTTTTTTVPNGWSPLWPEDEGGRRDVEEWRPLVEQYWAADRVDCVLGIILHESEGDPQAHNARSNAEGLMQHLARYWEGRAEGAGFRDSNGLYASYYNAEANIAAGAYLASFYTTWYSPWSRTYDYGTCSAS